MHCCSLESDEGLLQFQAGRIPEKDQSWYRFVPPQAQEALGKHEVERQSAIFELFTAEKDYVDDLALIREVGISLRTIAASCPCLYTCF